MSDTPWMIYGANGYTGALAAERAVKQGLKPVLAGRSADKIRPLAEKLGLEWRAFALTPVEEAAKSLKGMKAVLHCAGPFSATSRPMVDACIRAGVHYMDITGEIDVFESSFARDADARAAGVVLMSGVGFDVVPSDCLAATLKNALPDATDLELAFSGLPNVSPGTAKTAVENLPNGGKARVDGRLVNVPAAWRSRDITFSGKTQSCVTIPWGDVSTAYVSTGIPNIAVYVPMPRAAIMGMKLGRPFMGLLGAAPVQNFLKGQIEKRVKGPSEQHRATGRVNLWGQAKNAAGKTVTAELEVPEGYDFTVTAALACTVRILAGEVPGGAWTPSKAFGADFVTRLPGTRLTVN